MWFFVFDRDDKSIFVCSRCVRCAAKRCRCRFRHSRFRKIYKCYEMLWKKIHLLKREINCRIWYSESRIFQIFNPLWNRITPGRNLTLFSSRFRTFMGKKSTNHFRSSLSSALFWIQPNTFLNPTLSRDLTHDSCSFRSRKKITNL